MFDKYDGMYWISVCFYGYDAEWACVGIHANQLAARLEAAGSGGVYYYGSVPRFDGVDASIKDHRTVSDPERRFP